MKAEQVLTAEYTVSDSDLTVSKIDGLETAIERVEETHKRELVRCEDRVMDYDVYWNEKTSSVRIGAVAMLASYEVTDDTTLGDYE